MGLYVSEFELSVALSVSTQSVRRRAEKEGWPHTQRPTRGGSKYFYLFDLLPDDVKARVAEERNRK